MSTNTEKERRQWLWFIALLCMGPVCMIVIDLIVKDILAIGFEH